MTLQHLRRVLMYLHTPVGYYLATLEAATQHIFDLAGQFEKASADVATAVDGQGDDTATGLEEKIILP